MTALSFLARRSMKPVTVEIPDGASVEVGRCREGEAPGLREHDGGLRLALDVPSLSDRHARLAVHDGRVRVEDLGSRNGTLLRLDPGEAHAVEGGALWLGPDLTLQADGARWELPDAPHDMTPEGLLAWLGARLKARGLVAELVPAGDEALRLEGQSMRLAVRPAERLGTVDADAQGWVQAVISVWNASRHRPPGAGWRFVATSPARRRSLAQCERLAVVDRPMLLVGAGDSGRRVLAQDLHDHGPWREGPFVTFRVDSVARERVEPALFGEEIEGVRRRGLVAQAEGGTLYVDDVALLPAPAQVRLLHLIESGDLRRARVRLVAATTRELKGRAEGFREDLYWHLASLRVDVPPPAQEDLPGIAREVLGRASEGAGRRLDPATASDLARRAAANAWRGGVRGMCEALERLAREKHPDTGWQEALDAAVASSRVAASPSLPPQLPVAPAALGRMVADLLFLRAAEETPQRAALARRLQMTYQGADARVEALGVDLDQPTRVAEARKGLEATLRRTLADAPGLREVLRALTDP